MPSLQDDLKAGPRGKCIPVNEYCKKSERFQVNLNLHLKKPEKGKKKKTP